MVKTNLQTKTRAGKQSQGKQTNAGQPMADMNSVLHSLEQKEDSFPGFRHDNFQPQKLTNEQLSTQTANFNITNQTSSNELNNVGSILGNNGNFPFDKKHSIQPLCYENSSPAYSPDNNQYKQGTQVAVNFSLFQQESLPKMNSIQQTDSTRQHQVIRPQPSRAANAWPPANPPININVGNVAFEPTISGQFDATLQKQPSLPRVSSFGKNFVPQQPAPVKKLIATSPAPVVKIEDDVSEQSKSGKKRGRKMTEEAQYYKNSEKQIARWKEELKNEKNVKKRQILRNRISAQQSRTKKKMESSNLESNFKTYKAQFGKLVKILHKELKGTCRDQVCKGIFEALPETSAFEQLPQTIPSYSLPEAGARLTRRTSRNFKDKNPLAKRGSGGTNGNPKADLESLLKAMLDVDSF